MEELSQENIWSLELGRLYLSKDLNLLKTYLTDLLDLLVYLHEILAEENIQVDETEVLSEELVMKFYFHGLTLNNTSDGFNLKSKYYDYSKSSKVKLVDLSSILTVGRAQLETLLMYQHLYINSENKNELKLRYYAWIYTALIQRSQTPATTEHAKTQKKRDADEMENLRNKIKELYSSTGLSEKQQKSLLENGSVKLFKHWDTIFKESGFGNGIFNRMYYILSVYSHSEGLSIIQMKSAKYLLDKEENSSMVFMQLFCSTLMTAVMIKNICSKHKSCNGRFKEIDPKEQHAVNFFTKLAKKAIA